MEERRTLPEFLARPLPATGRGAWAPLGLPRRRWPLGAASDAELRSVASSPSISLLQTPLPALPAFASLCPPLESLALARLLDSLRCGRCNCPVAISGYLPVGQLAVESRPNGSYPLTGLSVNRTKPLARSPTQPVVILHILSPPARPLAVAVVWTRAPPLFSRSAAPPLGAAGPSPSAASASRFSGWLFYHPGSPTQIFGRLGRKRRN